MLRSTDFGVAVVAAFFATGCVRSAKSSLASDEGIASWYGNQFRGKKTANGEVFNPDALTAAHRTLPFGTKVRVTNLRNGKSVVVRINDRGPFIRGRVIDLSLGAAKLVGLTRLGVAKVKYSVLN